jgi:uncharacterized flavoprotein (TIGR03862 family)
LPTIAIIGAGPAGLIAAEMLERTGAEVTVYERMTSPARKFLMAGLGGLNLTHSEAIDRLITRYGDAASRLRPTIEAFPPSALAAWCEGLGQTVFTGSSGRVFPRCFKTSPVLRAWLRRLQETGVELKLRHDWRGWDPSGRLIFQTAEGAKLIRADATLLALGGASWPRLGTDGSWQRILASKEIAMTALRPANCGFVVPWSATFRERFEGEPVKPVTLSFGAQSVRGEFIITGQGIEGGAVYALSRSLRETIENSGEAVLTLDLRPDLSEGELARRLGAARGRQSLSTYLRKAGGLSRVAVGLISEVGMGGVQAPAAMAAAIKALPVRLTGTSPIDRAISSAGGVALAALDDHFMVRDHPGLFVAGEMIDWEAPTGGYLLQACFSTGVAAAAGITVWLKA